ncbi:MAG: hypothetical protein AB9834_12860 [Lentimicrobium sp.]
MKNLFILLALVCGINAAAQVSINTDGSAPDNSAMLDVKSTSKGMLVPRMTAAERNAISNPATSLLIFCIDNNQFYSNKGTPSAPNWVMISSQWLTNGSGIYFTGGNIGLGLTTPGYQVDVAGDINFSGTLRKNGLPVVSGVSGVSATLPLLSSGGVNPDISIPQANSLTNGFLSMGDWAMFNNKQNALTFGNLTSGDITLTGGNGAVIGIGTNMTINKGNLTEAVSSVLTITGGSGAVLGSGVSLQVKQANTVQPGFLSSSDWNGFNNKVSSQWTTNGQNISYMAGKVSVGTTSPAASAALEVNSTSQGFLPPRMTMAQRDAISSPVDGLMIYCTDCPAPNNVQVFTNTHWYPMAFNRFPNASNVNQSGLATVSLPLTGGYTYNDADNDPEGTSLYKWYRSDNSSGLNEAEISGATSQTYTLTTADVDKYIRFSVTPLAQTGASPGDEVKAMEYAGPVVSWTCGIYTLTINHLAGSVAPVNKTVTYSTVTNIPGEPAKCWITSNLGADREATNAYDGSEASAGWYWQFNRMQGYKHDGSSRTPNTAWISNINEDFDWQASNDPCRIELGTGWRIPTSAEWSNVDATGGWTNGNEPYVSDLRLHSAGELDNTGILIYRGQLGAYWANTQSDPANAYWLYFNSGQCGMNTDEKITGKSLRCINNN